MLNLKPTNFLCINVSINVPTGIKTCPLNAFELFISLQILSKNIIENDVERSSAECNSTERSFAEILLI